MASADGLNGPFAGPAALLRHRAAESPDAALFAFLADDEGGAATSLTRGGLDRRARSLAGRLRAAASAGGRALLMFPPGLEFIEAFFGCLYAGMIAVPASPPRRNRSMARLGAMVADARPGLVLTTAGLLADADAWAEGVAGLAGLPRVAVDAPGEGRAEVGPDLDLDADPDAIAFLQYTSGSTSTPKGVAITHGNLLRNSALIASCFGSGPESRGVFWLPLFHDMGLIGGVLQTLYCGGSSTLLSPVAFLQKPARWLQAISRTGATISGGPNFAYDLCVDKVAPEQRAGLDLSRWSVAFNGAEPVRPETLDRFARAFADSGFRPGAFLPCYGLAEATLLVSGRRAGPPAVKAVDAEALGRGEVVAATAGTARPRQVVGSGGVAEPGSVAIVDPGTGLRLPEGRVGEIWVSGPSVAQGYWGDPEATRGAFRATIADSGEGPFVRTGDLGFLGPDGLFVAGRIKDLMIFRGRNVYPQDVEATVGRAHPGLAVGGSAAFAVEVEGADRLVVVAEVERSSRREGGDEAIAAIRRAVAEQHDLDIHAIRLIRPMSLPKTSSGKVRRHACRAEYLAGTLAEVAAWTRRDGASTPPAPGPGAAPGPAVAARSEAEIGRWLAAKVAGPLGVRPEAIDARRPLASYGLGSLQAVTLAGELEAWVGRPVPPTIAYDYPTIAALARHLAGGPEADRGAGEPRPVADPGEPIAIIGIGCRFPGADGPGAFWDLLRDGREAVGPPPSGRGADGLLRRAGYLDRVDGFDADFFGISPREAAYIDPQQRLLLEVAWEALADAGQDPARLAGSGVGTFMGVATSDYAQLQSGRGAARDGYQVAGGAASIAANRLAYFFDFRGPSLAIDTACSSSLVAVQLACKSLRDGESTLALAGGVNLILAPEVDAGFAKAGFLAPDGRCKTFDARADGYVRGEGAGVVVLKPLGRALADGDPIHGLIRGGAVNQDGRTNGLTAPSRSSQEAVLRAACHAAGVDPGRVDYVEAHGTGTLLGDQIELAALGAVLGEGRPEARPCVLGSVKTNIGHLEAAAGVAGLIKAALALRHRAIPASLNYETPNPHAFDGPGPLRVGSAFEAWPRGEGDGPALAGVSSFGFGGTNAHVILQEAPPVAPAPAAVADEPRARVLPLSAGSPAALRALAGSYRGALAGSLDLADLAHTLGARRGHLDHRLALVAGDRDELAAALDAASRGEGHASAFEGRKVAGRRPKLAFVFSGQGGLWPGAGLDLLARDSAARLAFEKADREVRCLTGWSPWTELAAEGEASRLRRADVAQPVQFALQLALAALWRSWGIEPDAIVGHSLGEVAAAHAAGALTLADAARVVVERGRLMQRAAGRGLTAAVALSADEARRRAAEGGGRITVAAINGPTSTVVSGDAHAVGAFVAACRAEGRFARLLDVDSAFHSPAMDDVRRDLEAALDAIRPQPAGVRLVSTVTGADIDGADLGAGYWARNVRDPVRFADAVASLAVDDFGAFLEVGPHPILAVPMAEGLDAAGREGLILPSLERGKMGPSTPLRSVARLYARGFDPAWAEVNPPGRCVRLPSYPWQRERAWFDDGEATPAPTLGHAAPTVAGLAPEPDAPRGPYYRTRWEPRAGAGGDPTDLGGPWLIVGRPGAEADALLARIEARGGTGTVVTPEAAAPAVAAGRDLRGVVHLAPLDLAIGDDEALARASGAILDLARALGQGPGPKPRLWIVTRGGQPVDGEPGPVSAVQATFWGLGRSLAREQPETWGGLVDLDPARPLGDLDALLGAVGDPDGEDEVAFRRGAAFASRLVVVEGPTAAGAGLVVRPGGTYLITGGLGDLGLLVARRLVDRGARRLVLVGRNPLPDRASWSTLAEGHPARARVAAIAGLEDRGATVLAASVDVADPAGMAALFDRLRRDWPPMTGIVHAAGVVEPRPLADLDGARLQATLRPKVAGTRVLDDLSRGLPLDFFVLFSSIASAWGSARLVDYAAANAFLDATAHARRAEGLPALAVNWGPWADGGMAASGDRGRSLALLGLKPLRADAALDALDDLASLGVAQAIVADVEWSTFKALHDRHGRGRLLDRMGREPREPGANPLGDELGRLSVDERRGRLLAGFRGHVARVLKLPEDRVEPDRPLLTFGLDSLLAMELRGGIEAEFGPVLPLSVLLQGPSLRELADRAAEGWSDPGPVAAPGPRAIEAGAAEVRRPSAGQQMLWYAHQFEPTGAAYNLAGAARVRAGIDVEAVRRALGRVAARQESLRSTFALEGGKPAVRVAGAAGFLARSAEWFPVEDAAGLDDRAIEARLGELARRPFDLEAGPLFRLHLLTRSATDHVLLLVFHHAIGDFWSTAVLLDEFGRAYRAELDGEGADLPPLRLGYADFIRWQDDFLAGPEGARQWDYWRDQLAGPLPTLDLPTDHPRPAVRSYRGAVRHYGLDPDLTRAIVGLGESRGSSLYTTLLAAFGALLARVSGQDEVVVGSPVAGRSRPGFEDVVGYFVNMLPMRVDLAGDPSFDEALARARRAVVGALEHQDFPYHLMAERLQPRPDPGRTPLFAASYIHQKAQRLDDRGLTPFALSAAGPMMELEGLPLESLVVDKGASLFDLTLMTARDGDGLALAFEYSTDLFDPATIDRLAGHFETLLRGIVADPSGPVSAFPLLSGPERRQILETWAPGPAAGIAGGWLHQRFEAHALRTPDAEALAFGEVRLTYAEVNAGANRLARSLIARGVGPEAVVGLCVGRSPSMVVGLLGILKAGAAYLPIDPEHPRDRIAAILEDARPALVLVDESTRDRLPGAGVEVAAIEPSGPDGGNPDVEVAGSNLAYVIFTSGSTGRPKGVAVEHATLAAVASAWAGAYDLAGRPIPHLQAAGFAFDVFTGDVARALGTGGSLVSAARETLLDPPALLDLFRRERVGCAELVPAAASGLADELGRDGRGLPDLRVLAVGSDLLRGGLYGRLRDLLGPTGRVLNSYGLTEATVDSSYYDGPPPPGDGPVPVGRPIAGTRLYVLDRRLEPVPAGVAGELFIGGAGVARGYVGDPGRTALRFVPDPFGPAGGRLYRTGDRARWSAGGQVELLGRADGQVKVRGHRIELGEVEAALLRLGLARDAVVVAPEGPGGARRLVAYVVPIAGPEPSTADLRRGLKGSLPDVMVPAAFVLLDRLPLSPNGKVDRSALPDPGAADHPGEDGPPSAPPRNAAEATLARITVDLLGHNHIGIHDNFFEIGIDSILGVQMISRAREQGLRLSPIHLFRHPTIAELAAAAGPGPAPSTAEVAADAPFALAPEGVDPGAVARELAAEGEVEDLYPLTPVQEGMLFHSLADGDGGAYVEQFLCRIRGPLDPPSFAEAWNRLVARHPALRSTIHWSDSGRPFQVVRRRAEPPLAVEDWRDSTPAEQERRLADFLARDRRIGFVPSWPPLMRVALFRLADGVHQLAWSVHHVIVDGWCLSVLLGELIDLYEAIRRGAEASLPPTRPFRDYVRWLGEQDRAPAERFWRRALAGFAEATPIGGLGPAAGGAPGSIGERELALSAATTAGLVALARRGRVTLGTLVQGAWALLLARYSGRGDVAFGVTVSGRPAELAGVETMVGLFINTLPARVAVDEDADLIPWLRDLQAGMAEGRRHETTPLPQIQAWSEVPRGRPLFESILVVQNLPYDSGLLDRAGRLGIEAARYRERTHYPLTVVAIPGERLRLRIGHDDRRFDAEGVDLRLDHLRNLLTSMVDDPDRKLADLPMLADAEHDMLLGRWDAAGEAIDHRDLDHLSEREIDSLYEELRRPRGPGSKA